MANRASCAAAVTLCLAVAGCGRDPYPRLVEDCTTKAGAWRYGTVQGDMVLVSVDQDPLERAGSARQPRVVDAPFSAHWMLEHGLRAVEFPMMSEAGFDPVGRVSLLDQGDERCDVFAHDRETLEAAGRLDLRADEGLCIGLERGVRRQARYAMANYERTADGAAVVELIDLQTRQVLARVVTFVEPGGRSCRDTPKGAPADNAIDFVMASLKPGTPPGDPD